MSIMPENITVSRSKYERALLKAEMYDCLRACGVDQWEGYSQAMKMYEKGQCEEE